MNGVRLLRDAVARPSRCACIPYVGSSREPVGFFDFGSELFGEHIYVSYTAFAEMAKVAMYVPMTRGTDPERDRLAARLAEAEAELASTRAQLDAVGVLKAGGFTAARKPGRPKKEAVPA